MGSWSENEGKTWGEKEVSLERCWEVKERKKKIHGEKTAGTRKYI